MDPDDATGASRRGAAGASGETAGTAEEWKPAVHRRSPAAMGAPQRHGRSRPRPLETHAVSIRVKSLPSSRPGVAWGHAVALAEAAVEVGEVAEADVVGNGADGAMGLGRVGEVPVRQ